MPAGFGLVDEHDSLLISSFRRVGWSCLHSDRLGFQVEFHEYVSGGGRERFVIASHGCFPAGSQACLAQETVSWVGTDGDVNEVDRDMIGCGGSPPSGIEHNLSSIQINRILAIWNMSWFLDILAGIYHCPRDK